MKNQLPAFALAAIFVKSVFIPQLASAQNSRIWATYYGGGYSETGRSVATDKAGNVYLAGSTLSFNCIASGGFQNNIYGGDSFSSNASNAFLVKFDANGNRLWATYYGDTIQTDGYSVATDAAGNVYLAGTTCDSLRIASGGFQNTFGGGENAFLVKFDANGNRLWATYYGTNSDNDNNGNKANFGRSVATDAAGNVYLAGSTSDTSGIASGGFQNTYGGGASNAFLVKFDANGNRLWATYYGGTLGTFGYCIATDVTGNVYLTGNTLDSNGIASGGFQDTLAGGVYFGDAFLVKFDANGNRLWATYYGIGFYSLASLTGSIGQGIATDGASNVYLTGLTDDTSGIASGGFQNTYGGGIYENDAFLVKFDASGNRIWGTYYGGVLDDRGMGVAADSAGNVWLGGSTNDTGMASGGFQDSLVLYGDISELFLVKFDANGNRLCGTYYNGQNGISTSVGSVGVALDNAGNVYVGSTTHDTLGIASANGFQIIFGCTSNGDNDKETDADLIKFNQATFALPSANFQSSDTIFCANNCINYTDLSTNANSWQWSFPGATPSSSTLQNPQGICYDTSGTYNATLIASNSVGEKDTLKVINLIHVLPVPPTPVITQHNDTLFCSTDPSYTSYQWYDSTSIIPGSTNTFLVITHGGNYNVAVTNEYGCRISVGITIILGIQNYAVSNLFSLSPNPAYTQITIHTSSSHISGSATVSIMNVLGQEITPLTPLHMERGEAFIDISKLPTGMYFLQMKTESENEVKRFVKE